MRVTVIGARGFVGSAFVRLLERYDLELLCVTRENYAALAGKRSDVVVEAACNSRKYLADRDPFAEYELSVHHRLSTLRDFPAELQLHVSSVDVYSDLTAPATTREDSAIDVGRQSHYGFHKLLAEELVRHHAPGWLIVRLAGMVGPGLRKNPVFDLIHGQPLRIHPDSQYQFMRTDDAAAAAWALVERGVQGEVFNVCGEGLISPREIATMLLREPDRGELLPGAHPRIVHVCTDKIAGLLPVPSTHASVGAFVREQVGESGAR